MDPDQLYALPPEEFTAARDAAVKAAKVQGDVERAATLRGLRRPSVAAWLLNRLAREQADLLEQMLALGPALAQAQSSGNADDLRTLGRQRRELVEAVAGGAVSAAGRPVASAVRDEVVNTLEAALADPASAEAVRGGRLVRALAYAGFGDADLSGAVDVSVAPSPSPVEPSPRAAAPGRADEAAARARAALAAAEQAANSAAGRLDDAVRAADRAGREATQAAGALEQVEQALRQAEQTLARAVAARDAARAADAEAEATSARDVVRVAQDDAEAARAQLDRLRRG